MRRLGFICALAALLAVSTFASAQNTEVTLSRSYAAIGEPVGLTIVLETPDGAVVDVNPDAESWGDVRFLKLISQESIRFQEGLSHRIEMLVAPFAFGSVSFQPSVTITTDAGFTFVDLPVLTLDVPSILIPGEALALSRLQGPVPIEGAQSPLFWPAIVIGSLGALTALCLVGLISLRRWVGDRENNDALLEPLSAPVDALASAESLIEADAQGAYRAISVAIRQILAERYGFPAQSLTTVELETRMAVAGVDGWEERMARELLRECDAVVYAGYRPALERRQADIRVAREILGDAI
ncbi:MAG: hypothetical protein CL897_06205 [Dehalococcoidia bacterium]|nr:hypothetical protein [Dehalococcoidia bacterium]